jgi:hypothetical protein
MLRRILALCLVGLASSTAFPSAFARGAAAVGPGSAPGGARHVAPSPVVDAGAVPAPARPRPRAAERQVRGCPASMVRVEDYCVDRFEVSMVDRKTDEPLSPYYPPQPVLLRRVREVWQSERFEEGSESATGMPLPDLSNWQTTHRFQPKAVSVRGVVPQGYLSYYTAKEACENAGKRLCTHDEWVTACEGARHTRFPYGDRFDRSKCNVYRYYHPAYVLHDNSSIGHTDPRLNLVVEHGRDPVLRNTGATRSCASRWGKDRIYDMVGNLDEWVEDKGGMFVGGFYARGTTKGCESKITVHARAYYDYSLGTRCCRDAR